MTCILRQGTVTKKLCMKASDFRKENKEVKDDMSGRLETRPLGPVPIFLGFVSGMMGIYRKLLGAQLPKIDPGPRGLVSDF